MTQSIKHQCPFCNRSLENQKRGGLLREVKCHDCSILALYHCKLKEWTLIRYSLNDPNKTYYCLSISMGSVGGNETTIILLNGTDFVIPDYAPMPLPKDALQMARRLHGLTAFT
jgi:hypothetical protein